MSLELQYTVHRMKPFGKCQIWMSASVVQVNSGIIVLDVLISFLVSISRRLQDPLAELVKIGPKHLGVGMYQHDVAENQLKSALDSVVEECVNFVGVDLNVCNEIILRFVDSS
jgi:hypothetical protein